MPNIIIANEIGKKICVIIVVASILITAFVDR